MHERFVHEVATPLQLSIADMEWGPLPADNDESYKEYTRLLRSFTRMAWDHHDCSFCKEGISPGEWYWCEIHVSLEDGKKKFYVIKKHDPVCPDELRDMEEQRERELDREERAAHREAA